jgi:uncharacterized cupin superfamily protein
MGSFISKRSSSPSPEKSAAPATMSPPPFTHFVGAQTSFSPPLISANNAFLGDVASSGTSKLAHAQPCPDDVAPISCGFYRQEAGVPLVYEYTYHEMKIIVDGEFDISDETGQTVHAVKGDVFYFPKGSKITFSTPTFGLGFFCGQRKVCPPPTSCFFGFYLPLVPSWGMCCV